MLINSSVDGILSALPWIYRSDGFARFGLDKLIVDEQTPWLLVFAAVRRRELNEEIRHIASSRIVSDNGRVIGS
jgi:hypothetical protein